MSESTVTISDVYEAGCHHKPVYDIHFRDGPLPDWRLACEEHVRQFAADLDHCEPLSDPQGQR